MKKLFLLTIFIAFASCKETGTGVGAETEEDVKINNLYSRGLQYIDSLDIYNAIAMYDELSLEYNGSKKANQLKDSIIAQKNKIVEKLNIEKEQSSKKIYKEYDEFKKITWFKPISEKNQYGNSIYCYFGVEDSGAVMNPRLVIVYYDQDWIFWEKADFLIDGEVIPYIPEERPTTDNNSSVWEISDESIDTALSYTLNQMFDAKEVKYRLNGRSGVRDFNLSKSKIKSIEAVIKLHNAMSSLKSLESFK